MQELSEWLKNNTGENLAGNIADAVARAKLDTLAEIQRLHPKRVRGHNLDNDWVRLSTSKQNAQIFYQSGKGVVIPVMFYSTYLARWEMTGAFGRIIKSGKVRKGQYGPTYESRSDFYQQNSGVIDDFMATRIYEYLTNEWR